MANDLNANLLISPTVDWNFDASTDTDGDGVWDEDGTAFNGGTTWTFTGAGQAPDDVTAETNLVQLTSAFGFNTGGSSITGATSASSFQDAGSDQSDASFEIWFKADGTATGAQVLFETGSDGDGLSIVLDDLDADGYDDIVLTVTDGGTTIQTTADLGSLVVGGDITQEYIQIVGVYDRTSSFPSLDFLDLYVNGTFIVTDSDTTVEDFDDDSGTGLGAANGASVAGYAGGAGAFTGDIAIFRAYEGQALVASDVQQNFLAVATGGLSLSAVNGRAANIGTPITTFDTGLGANGGTVTVNTDGSFSFDPGTDFDYLNAGESTTATFTYSITDALGNTSDTATVSIEVTGANDAPINTVPGAQTVNEETATSISGISVNDVDNNLASTQLTVTDGVLTVSLSGSATISAGANGSNDLTISGSEADINATLASLTYTGDVDFVGADTLTVISTDSGGVPLSDTDTVTINVTDINDEPIVTTLAGVNDTFTEGELATNPLFASSDIDTIEAGQNIDALVFTVTNVNDGANETLNIDGTSVTLTNGASATGTNYDISVSVAGSTATITLTASTLDTVPPATADAVINTFQNGSLTKIKLLYSVF